MSKKPYKKEDFTGHLSEKNILHLLYWSMEDEPTDQGIA